MKKIILIAVLSLVFAGGFQAVKANAALNLSGWAWTSTMGWLSFNSSNTGSGANYAVSAATSTLSPNIASLSGYAWGAVDDNGKPSGIGWVSFSSSNTGCPTTEALFDTPASQGGGASGAELPSGVSNICTPRVDLSTGKVSGWARVLNMAAEDATAGWLHLSGTNHQTGAGGVSYNKNTGAFSGKAWEPSAIGWLDFAANTSVPYPPVVICVTGTPGCPPVGGGTCSIGTITTSGNDVMIPVHFPTSGSTWYILNRDGVEVDRGRSDDVFTDPGLALVPGTYTYQIVYKGPPISACGNPVVYTVNGQPPVGGPLQLYIGPSVSSANQSSYTTHRNSPFTLKWRNDLLADGYSCTPSSSGSWGGWGSDASGNAALNSGAVNPGTYSFTISCNKAASFINASANLIVTSSSLEEI
jgi:hypothetical protein